jgi:glutaconate CoA-transferase subunit A
MSLLQPPMPPEAISTPPTPSSGPNTRRVADKQCSLKEAVAHSVHSGDQVLLDGFTHLIPFAAGHEIIRQNIRDLTAIRLTPDLIYDQLIEAGCVKKLVFSWAGNPGVGSLHAFRRRTQRTPEKGLPGSESKLQSNPSPDSSPRLELEEYSHFGMVARLLAGSSGLPFWPLRNYAGSNLADANPLIRTVHCPFTGETLAAVPALRPDVAILHCQRADRQGNAQIWGLMGTQKEAAFASKRVILIAEEIVDSSVIRADPNRTLIPSLVVDHVVHEPWGAHPSYVQGYYDRDNDFYVAWEEISRDPIAYSRYLETFVFDCPDRAAYCKRLDPALLQKLKARPRTCAGVDYGY